MRISDIIYLVWKEDVIYLKKWYYLFEEVILLI